MASAQCYKEVDQTTITTTTVTSHKVENEQQHHSLTDKVKEMADKVFHHNAHKQHGHQSACQGSTVTCEKKEGFVEKMKTQLKTIGGKKKHREGNCNGSSDSSSDESDDEK